MHDVDCIAHIQGLAQPTGHPRPCLNSQALRLVPRSEDADGIASHVGGGRNFRQELSVRTAEAELAVGLSIHLIALLVDRAVVPAAE